MTSLFLIYIYKRIHKHIYFFRFTIWMCSYVCISLYVIPKSLCCLFRTCCVIFIHVSKYQMQLLPVRSDNILILGIVGLSFVEKSIYENSKSSAKKVTFDGSRKDINAAMDRICEFTGNSSFFILLFPCADTWKLLPVLWFLFILKYHLLVAGTKIIFWDLREPFIENLYKSSVSVSRFEAVIEPLDTVRFFPLATFYICDIIKTVALVWHAYIWVNFLAA